MRLRVVLVVLGVLLLLCAIAVQVGNASSEEYGLRIRWLRFEHEKLVMYDYIFEVEFEVPGVGHYEAQRTPSSRYLSEHPPLTFDVQESWLNLSARLTIIAFWHADDVIIDINPNPADGRWTPFGKKASALMISYTIGSEPMERCADGEDDGYIADLRNDAYIKLVVETLKDGEVIPEFPTFLWLTALMVAGFTVVLLRKLTELRCSHREM